MALTLVQSTNGAGANATSKAVSFVSNVAAGNLLVVCIATDNTSRTISSISDTRGSTWTAGTAVSSADGKILTQIRWTVVGSSGADTVTVNFTGGVNSIVALHEFSGLNSTPFDVASQTTSTAANPTTSTTATLAQADELIFAFGAFESTTVPTAGGSYTIIQTGTFGTSRFGTEWQESSATTGVVGNFTHASGTANVHVITFTVSGGGGGGGGTVSSSLSLMGCGI